MWALIKEGAVDKLLSSPKSITVNDVTYPGNILTKWNASDLAELGIKPFRAESVDHRYYFAAEMTYTITDTEVVGTVTATPRKVEDLKKSLLVEVKNQASSRLSSTDWMVVRAVEGGTAVPDDVTAYRAAVREASNTKEAEIEALADLDAVKAYEAQSFVEVRKVTHTAEDGTITYGPETTEITCVMRGVDTNWPTDPLAEVDPAFVSLTAA